MKLESKDFFWALLLFGGHEAMGGKPIARVKSEWGEAGELVLEVCSRKAG